MCTSTTASHIASSILRKLLSRRMPALFTSTSTRPNASTPLLTIAAAPAVVDTLSWLETATPPALVISSTTWLAGLASWPAPSREPPTSLTTTFAPSRARSRACARPMPPPAPVTIATLPSRRPIGAAPGAACSGGGAHRPAMDRCRMLAMVGAGRRDGPGGRRGRRSGSGSALAVLILAVTLGVACHSSGGGPSGPPAEVDFPKGFLWGASTAGFQVESGDSHTDWAHWAASPGKIKNADSPDVGGPDALAHVDEDIAVLVNSGQNAYRFSIEWGRVYPTQADFDADTPDPAGLAAYDALFQKLAAAHITPLVTLVHFSLPDWLSDGIPANFQQPQGWERQGMVDEYVTWCTRAAKRWGNTVDWWVTINEPLPYVLGGFIQGSFPPGDVLNVTRALAVAKTEARAHARCYDAIHAADTIDADGDGVAAWVSIAKHQRTFHPYDTTEPDDATATTHVEYLWNQWFLNAIVHGDWDDDFDGLFTGPNDVQGDPTLKGRADYLGINYYSDTLISAHQHGIIIPARVSAVVIQANMPTGRPETDFAWDIYPEGLGTVLDE